MAKNNKKTKVAIIIFLITAIVATALTAVLAFGDSNEGYRTITVIEIQGTVGVVHDNIEYPAYTGMHLEEGYTVVTGGNSYIRLLLDDDKYVKLESGTKAIFSEVSGGKTSINIERGALVAEVTKPLQVDEDFIVNTPNAVLAVRGTLFRVDLSRNDKGELNTDVMTYGGAVSSKRIQPTGEVEDIEVTIKEGFKATVNMDDKETVYLVDEVKVDLSALVGKPSNDNKPGDTTTETNLNGEIIESAPITLESVLMPIVVEDIPDDDLIDIYFASENGHSMFIETKEIEEKIVERNIDVTQKTSVYEVAEKVKEPVEIVIPDDNKSLVTTTEPVTEVVAVQGPPNDGVGDETTTEITTVPSTTAPTTTVPSTTAPTTTVPSTTAPTTTVPSTTAPTTTVPSTIVSTTTVPTTESTTVTTTEQTTEPTTEETTVHTHKEVTEEVRATCTKNGLKTVKCSDCGEIISETVLTATGHTEKTTTEAATCTVDGKTTVTCSTCGETIKETVLTATGHSEEKITIEPTCTEAGKETITCTVCDELISETILNATGHREIFSGAKDAHTECSVCYEVLSTNHSYTTSTTNPSCTLDGGTTYVCECGYNYTDMIPATGHTEKTTTVDATCTVDGKTTVSCSVCTETLSETVIPATGHTEENGAGADIHTKCSVCGSTVKDGSYHDYTDEVTTQNTCTSEGVLTHTCTCGWSYTEEIPASHKKSDDGLTCANGCGGVWVDLNSTNFPDSMFLAYISTTYDADGNNALIGNEVTGVTTINVAGDSTADGGYTDLTGINNFTNLVNVNCAYNSGITSLDLSGLTLLTELDVTGLTGLETLNISGCTNLTDEKITGLDTCTALIELNVSGCTNIAELNLNSNTKVETVNLSNCSALTSFVIDDNSSTYALSSIDLAGCSALETLTINNALSLTAVDCTDLTAIKTIDLGGCQGITGTLDVSNKTNLTTLTIGSLKISSLNVTGCTALTTINATACTNLATITGTSSCTNLSTLTLVNTGLTSLDLEENSALVKLNVMNCTALTNLNLTRTTQSTTFNSLTVTGCTALQTLNLYNCKGLTSLVTTPLTALEELNLSYSGVTTINGVTDTMSFSQNTNLERVYLNDISSFTSVDISSNTKLTEFSLTGNSNVTTLDFTDIETLTTLSLSDVSALATLNIADCTDLESVSLLNTGLTSLSVTGSNALTQFWVYNNASLASLSLTGATSLTSVKLSADTANTALTSLAITNCTTLTSLDVTYLTQLTVLDVSNCSALTSITGLDSLSSKLQSLDLTGTGLTSITMSNYTALTTLYITECPNLTQLNLSYIENLTSVDLTDNPVLNEVVTYMVKPQNKTLSFAGNTALTSLYVRAAGETTTVDVTGCTNLDFLRCESCSSVTAITGLSDCTKLTELLCNDTSIPEIDTSALTELEILWAARYETTNIDVSKNTKLKQLEVRDSTIEELDLSDHPSLETLTIAGCTIGTLDVSGSQKLGSISGDTSNPPKIANIIASNSSVKSIFLTDDASSTVSIVAQNCPNLTMVYGKNFSNLTSVDFSGSTNLTEIYICNATKLTSLDISGLSKLELLWLHDMGSGTDVEFTGIDTGNGVSKNVDFTSYSSLKKMNLNNITDITGLNVSGLTSLQELHISGATSLTSVNTSGCSSLTQFSEGISNLTELTTLNASNSGLTTLDVSGNTSLATLNVSGCSALTSITGLDSLIELETLDVSNCDNLVGLMINSSALTSLNVSGSTNMLELVINNTNISDFSATGISTLQKLERFEAESSNISDNDLLDIMNSNTNLKTLNISNCENVISAFDTTGLTALESLNVSGTNITDLVITDNLNIVSVDASNCLLLGTSCFEYGDNGYNQLETVTFAGCEKLTTVQINNSTTLSTVTLTDAVALKDLLLTNCTDIATLDLSTCIAITSIDITGSSLTTTDITLPTGKDESIITGP